MRGKSALPWTIKYFPKDLNEFVGQSSAVSSLRNYVSSFARIRTKKRALLLYGPTGCGKTSLVYAFANQFNFEVIELNPSNFMDKASVDSKLKTAMHQLSLFGKKRLILIDGIDSITRKDRGALPEISKLILESPIPFVLTASFLDDPHEVPWASKFSSIKRVCTLVKMPPLSSDDIFRILKRIAVAEGVSVDDSILKRIARIESGDARAAITDFQVLYSANLLNEKGVDSLQFRDKESSIKDLIFRIFKTKNPEDALADFNYDADSLFLWLDENLPLEYNDARSLYNSYNLLSFADVLRGRIVKRQYWRFLDYIIFFLTYGISASKTKINKTFRDYKAPSRILKMWIYNNKLAKKKSIASKLARIEKCSTSEAFEYVSYLKFLFNHSEDLKKFINELGLTPDEVSWLKSGF